MSTDWRALCAELLDEVAARPLILDRELIARARAALAAEPVAAPAGPTDEELALIYHDFCRGCEFMDQGGFEDAARTLLARWGHQPAPPAEGEVADEARYLAKELRDQADDMSPALELFGLIHRAADMLEQFSSGWVVPTVEQFAPVPVAERLPDASDPRECRMPDGSCWWFDPHEDGAWYFDAYQGNYTHWLPAHALPLPAGEVE